MADYYRYFPYSKSVRLSDQIAMEGRARLIAEVLTEAPQLLAEINKAYQQISASYKESLDARQRALEDKLAFYRAEINTLEQLAAKVDSDAARSQIAEHIAELSKTVNEMMIFDTQSRNFLDAENLALYNKVLEGAFTLGRIIKTP